MGASGRACLTCKHARFIQPPDWEPSYTGETYDRSDVMRLIRKTEHHVGAQCTFNPVWLDVSTAHYCGQWDGLRRRENVDTLLWGSWETRERNALTKEVKELKTSLRKSRAISAQRLARLKKTGA